MLPVQPLPLAAAGALAAALPLALADAPPLALGDVLGAALVAGPPDDVVSPPPLLHAASPNAPATAAPVNRNLRRDSFLCCSSFMGFSFDLCRLFVPKE